MWYKKGVTPMVRGRLGRRRYMAWPRWEPLPGRFGRHRRQRDNIRQVAELVGRCERLHIHSAVFDTEAINYFLRALPQACGAREMHARILPDGIISIRRYPLTPLKAAAQYLRKLRRLVAPELDYWCFTGDRIGSDAPFCDRIYVLPGLPHEYPADKVVVLPPLVDAAPDVATRADRAARTGHWPAAGRCRADGGRGRRPTPGSIRDWLAGQGITEVVYKAHPKDPSHELRHPDYRLIDPAGALESHLAQTPYDAVIGVRSSALLLARQIYPAQVRVIAFGWESVQFRSDRERDDMRRAFSACGVEFA